MTVEHLNYACHPKEFFTKIVSFDTRYWVVRRCWRDWGEDHRTPPCRISWAEPESANIIGCLTDRPSGPPDCVSTIPAVMSRILSRIFGSFGLVVAAGNDW
jgi:hypothetical protein